MAESEFTDRGGDNIDSLIIQMGSVRYGLISYFWMTARSAARVMRLPATAIPSHAD
jgi:hypothetical protein